MAGTTGAIITCPLEVVKTRFQANLTGTNSTNGSYGRNSLNNHNNVYNATSSNKTQKLTNNSKLTTRLNCYSNILLRNNHLSHGTVSAPTTSNLMTNLFSFDSQTKQTHRHSLPKFSKNIFTRPDRISIYSQLKLTRNSFINLLFDY